MMMSFGTFIIGLILAIPGALVWLVLDEWSMRSAESEVM